MTGENVLQFPDRLQRLRAQIHLMMGDYTFTVKPPKGYAAAFLQSWAFKS